MIERGELVEYLDRYLAVGDVQDDCPNGLQVEGKTSIHRLAVGVTACQALLSRARRWGADAVLVHHGIFWNSKEGTRIERSLRQRLMILLDEKMSLLAYHLPLDCHPEVGNNAILAQQLGASKVEQAFPHRGTAIGLRCELPEAISADSFFARVARVTGRDPLVIPGGETKIMTFGIVTGRAPNSAVEAVRLGLDAFLTGEGSEPVVHLAREEGLHFIAAGHHATERFGVQALGDHLAKRFKLELSFLDIGNPV